VNVKFVTEVNLRMLEFKTGESIAGVIKITAAFPHGNFGHRSIWRHNTFRWREKGNDPLWKFQGQDPSKEEMVTGQNQYWTTMTWTTVYFCFPSYFHWTDHALLTLVSHRKCIWQWAPNEFHLVTTLGISPRDMGNSLWRLLALIY